MLLCLVGACMRLFGNGKSGRGVTGASTLDLVGVSCVLHSVLVCLLKNRNENKKQEKDQQRAD